MFVKPTTGRMVRDPVTKELLPENGKEVPNDSFWRKMLKHGDVEVVTSEASILSKKATKKEGGE